MLSVYVGFHVKISNKLVHILQSEFVVLLNFHCGIHTGSYEMEVEWLVHIPPVMACMVVARVW